MAFAYDTILEYLDERAADLVVLDSYPALIPPEEDEKSMDEYTMAEGAKMTNRFFRKVGKAGLRDYSDPEDRPWLGIFINQPRAKIGGFKAPGMPDPITTPGGNGKNFAFYSRLEVKRAEWIQDKAKNKIGQVIRTRTVKNKGSAPQRVASLDFYFTEGTNRDGVSFNRGEYDLAKDVLTMAVLFGVVKRGGAWYRYGEERWNGLKAMLDDLRERPDLMKQVEQETREVAGRPEDKRTWTEEDIESASTAQTRVPRRQRREGGDEDE
jgi:recombination protein RecA